MSPTHRPTKERIAAAPPPVEPYPTSLAHVLAELERIDLYIRLQVWRARHIKQRDDRFEGLYISEQEVDAIAAAPVGLPRWATAPVPWEESEVALAFAAIAKQVGARKAASAARGDVLRLDRLADLFALDRFDVDVLLVCLAPEIDLRYERLFAYLQDDVARRQPSVELALNLLCPSLPAKLEARRRFASTAPLLRHRLIETLEDPARPHAPLLGRVLRIDGRIAHFLLGSDEVDLLLAPFARLTPAGGAAAEELVASRELGRCLDALAAAAAEGSLLAHLHGPSGVGKRAWAAALAARLGRPLLEIDGARLLAAKDRDAIACARLACREASLAGAVLYWSGFDALLADERRSQRSALVSELVDRPGVNIVAGGMAWEPGLDARRVPFMSVPIARPGHAERERIWRREIGEEIAGDAAALAGRFRLTGGEIRSAAASARDRARWRAGAGAAVDTAELYAACRAQSSLRLGDLARKVPSHHAWNDLVLPAEATRQLREICAQVTHRPRVLEEWGYGAKLSLGKGLCAVFAGPSGTGKTMAAGIIAGELGLDLYKVDLSGMVSKYIGETEKNLARLFDEAETTNAILFFDEADALFGKRSEVKDAHDRYANIETGYLLQKMEEYEGITILASNLRRNMDEAFIRRMSFVVQFPFPEEDERLRIWRGVLPSATPRHEDVDLPFLAKQFKLSGGHIKNVALGAAFLAADDGGVLAMRHLARGVCRELQKMGNSFTAAQFGPYAGLLDV